MSQTKPPRVRRAVFTGKKGVKRIVMTSPKESSVQNSDADEATRLRHEIAILESKKRILKTLDALGV